MGPDLTHFAQPLDDRGGNAAEQRKAISGGWIADPQTIKPGNHMATVAVQAEDVQPLLDYLESLK